MAKKAAAKEPITVLATVPFASIVLGRNIRSKKADSATIQAMAKSMVEQGFYGTLTVSQDVDNYILRMGFTRYQAMNYLYEKDPGAFDQLFPEGIPVTIVARPPVDEGRDEADAYLDLQLSENVGRKDLMLTELVEAAQLMKNNGKSISEIATALHMGQKRAQGLLNISESLDETAYALADAGIITQTGVEKLAAQPLEDQRKIVKKLWGIAFKEGTGAASEAASAEVSTLPDEDGEVHRGPGRPKTWVVPHQKFEEARQLMLEATDQYADLFAAMDAGPDWYKDFGLDEDVQFFAGMYAAWAIYAGHLDPPEVFADLYK